MSGAVDLSHNDKIRCGFTTIVYLERESSDYVGTQDPVGGVAPFDGAPSAEPEILLDRDPILGRAPGIDGVRLDHPRVSRHHAQITNVNGNFYIVDLGSSNGTFVDGDRIAGRCELRVGNRIDIDPFSFSFTGHALLPSPRKGRLRVTASDVTVTGRDSQRILENLDFTVQAGDFICILGASGSGKSTLMKALSARGLRERDTVHRGTVFLNDVSLWSNFQVLKQSIALVPQRDVLYENITLGECIRYTARLRLASDSSAQDFDSVSGLRRQTW